MLKYSNLVNNLKEFTKKRPAASVAGIAVIILVLWGLISLLGGDDAASSVPTYTVKKGPLKISVTEDGTIQPREKIIVKNEVEGSTTVVYLIDEGTKVKKGDLLIELDSSTLSDNQVDQEITVQSAQASYISAREAYAVAQNQAESDIDDAQLTYEFAQQDLQKYIEGEYPNSLKEAESDITTAEEELSSAKDTLDWSKKLYEEGYLSESELNTDQLSYNQKAISVELKQAAKDLLVDYTHKRELAELESSVRQSKAALERTTRSAKASVVESEAALASKEAEYERQQAKLIKIENQLEKTKIYAPADGTVTYATTAEMSRSRWGSRDEPLELGSTVQERQELIHLPTDEGYNVEVSIPESALNKVKAGLPVLITVDTIDNVVFSGTVTSVSTVVNAENAFMNPDLKVYDTVIAVNNDENVGLLKSGMSCKAEIIVDQYEETTYVPMQAVMSVNGVKTVYVVKGSKLKPRTVETGLDNNTVIRIVSGLEPGELVSLSPPLAQSAATEQTFEKLSDVTIPATSTDAQGTGSDQQGQMPSGGQGGMPGGQQGGMPGGNSSSQGQMPSGGQGGMPSGGGNMITQMDKDGDGKVSKSEFSGPDDFFSQMDKDGDGYISEDEAPTGNRQGGNQGQQQGQEQSDNREEGNSSGLRYSTSGSISGGSSSGSGGGGMPGGGGGGGGPF